MLDIYGILSQYYNIGTPQWNILVEHSKAVAHLAVDIAEQHPELGADKMFVYEGAMLHDIGICETFAPGIYCFGTADYICHGTQGAQMLRNLGLEKHALVCERHTGAGITANEVAELKLPIPIADYTPQTIEEQIVCYADKFFSKTLKEPCNYSNYESLWQQKTFERALKSVAKYGDAPRDRFMAMHEKLSIPQTMI